MMETKNDLDNVSYIGKVVCHSFVYVGPFSENLLKRNEICWNAKAPENWTNEYKFWVLSNGY